MAVAQQFPLHCQGLALGNFSLGQLTSDGLHVGQDGEPAQHERLVVHEHQFTGRFPTHFQAQARCRCRQLAAAWVWIWVLPGS